MPPPDGHRQQSETTAPDRRRRVWELRVKYRMSLKQIQSKLTEEGFGRFSFGTLSQDWRREELRAQERSDRRIISFRAAQVASLEAIYCEAMLAWDRSVEDAKMLRERTVEVPAPTPRPGSPTLPPIIDRTERTHELRERIGDPRFLTVARQCVESISAMYELKPMSVDPTDPYAKLPPDVAARLRDLRTSQAEDTLAVLSGRDPEEDGIEFFGTN